MANRIATKKKTLKQEQQILFAKLSDPFVFLNYLSITNNSNELLMSKAFTSESKKEISINK